VVAVGSAIAGQPEITAPALAVGGVADLVSFGAKAVDATFFDGSTKEVLNQGAKIAVGKVVVSASPKVGRLKLGASP
jgi:hypothetical protein